MTKLSRFTVLVPLVLASIATAQTYRLTATASATGQESSQDTTTTGDSVFASNTGGTIGPDNPSFVQTVAQGGPSAATATSISSAESRGPTGSAGGIAQVGSQNDVISFNATTPFSIRVSFTVSDAVSTAWANDSARTNASATVINPFGGGAVNFNYGRTDDGESDNVIIDNREPGVIQMQPGHTLRTSLVISANSNAVASFEVADGAASASINAALHIEIISGTASIAGTLSGASYGPPPCNLADIAQPLGVLDIDDVLMFLTAFAGGCP